MDQIIQKEKERSLSSKEIYDLCHGKVRILAYDELAGVHDLNELFEPYNAFILLYQASDSYGHWVALTRRRCKDNGKWVIEFFDPYGYSIDQEIKMLPKRQGAQSYPRLTELLLTSGYDKCVVQNKRLQERGPGINTCGRWVALRVINKDMPLAKFISLFEGTRLAPDDYVVLMTI
jgi:hypothetical protein